MSYFLWIEDFENSAKVTATQVLGGINIDEQLFSDKKQLLKRDLKAHGIYVELSFQDGLGFIRQNLNQIDYIILDIDLAAYSKGDVLNADVLALLETFQDYKKLINETEDEQLLGEECAKLKALAGYYLYTELVVELGFPKQHILFCSNHGKNSLSTRDAFKTAKIALPTIYEKSDSRVQAWVKSSYENSYSRLRRGIIEGCRYLKSLPEDKLQFNAFISDNEKQVNIIDLHDYLDVLETFLPLREPTDKAVLYKLFIRTLTHEWEAAEPKNIKGLASIMKNTRNWITHNSILFNALDEKMVAYLFIINMRQFFSFNEEVQSYERILLDLYKEDALLEETFDNKIKNNLIAQDLGKAYRNLQNIASEDKRNNIRDAIRFTALANNIQESNSPLRNDKQLFTKLLYQMFWLINSYPRVDIKDRKELKINFYPYPYQKNTYIFELARHIHNHSFL